MIAERVRSDEQEGFANSISELMSTAILVGDKVYWEDRMQNR